MTDIPFLYTSPCRASVCLHLLWSFAHANPGRPFLLVWACWRRLAQEPGTRGRVALWSWSLFRAAGLGRFLTGIRGCHFAIK